MMGMYSPWNAVGPQSEGWLIDRPPLVQFVLVFASLKEGALEEWYSDFAQRAPTEYGRLGHVVDWLRTLSERITNRFVVFKKADPWMTRCSPMDLVDSTNFASGRF